MPVRSIFLALLGTFALSSSAGASPPQLGIDANYAREAFAKGQTYQVDGTALTGATDLFRTFAADGVRLFRVRVWVGETGTNHLADAIETAKAAQAAGLTPYVVLFLSDDWADLVKQPAPAAWRDLPPDRRAAVIQAYAADAAKRFADAGVNVETFEIGNEIDFGLCGVFEEAWPHRVSVDYMKQSIWPQMVPLIRAAESGVRSVRPDTTFVLHLAQWQNADYCEAFWSFMLANGVAVDFAGLSYFPTSAEDPSQRPLAFLRAQVDAISAAIDRPIMICETGFPTSSDFGGQFGAWNKPVPNSSLDEAGQARWVSDYVAFAQSDPHVAAAFYWSPEWTNNGIWDAFAFFDANGDARPALRAFATTRPTTAPASMPATTQAATISLIDPPAVAADAHVYLGNLHSHTADSDGTGTPDEAFAYARDVAKIDFLAVTDHNHLLGGDHATSAQREALYAGPPDTAVIPAASRATQNGKFVALYGQEFSSMSKGNHVNVFDVPAVIDVPNGQFDGLVKWLDAHRDSTGQPGIVMFNHPALSFPQNQINKTEYGHDDFGGDPAWVKAMGDVTPLIEVLNGEPEASAPHRSPQAMDHYYGLFLRLGFHLAPTADQDNHHKQWGDATDSRTGIVASELTKTALLAAMRARHVFASEDKNLRIIAVVNDHLCGDIFAVAGPTRVAVRLDDADEPDARYTIDIYQGTIGGKLASIVQSVDVTPEQATHGFVAFEGPTLAANQYLYLCITQTSTQGTDRAWTAPVWIESSSPASH